MRVDRAHPSVWACQCAIEYAMMALEREIDLITFTCHIPMGGELSGQTGYSYAT